MRRSAARHRWASTGFPAAGMAHPNIPQPLPPQDTAPGSSERGSMSAGLIRWVQPRLRIFEQKGVLLLWLESAERQRL